MKDIDKLCAAYSDMGVPYVIRTNGEYSYLFIGYPNSAKGILWARDNFETTDLETLCTRNNYFEFEHGSLVSFS